MFEIDKIFSEPPKTRPALNKDAIADLLRTTPEALDVFETAYAKHALDTDADDVFHVNSRQASERIHEAHAEETAPTEDETKAADALIERIVAELLAQTTVYVFDGELGRIHRPLALPAGTKMVTNEDVTALPVALRPELTGDLMKVDCGGEENYKLHLMNYVRYLEETNPKKKAEAYGFFRQGLDILDLDAVTYEMIGTNRNSMGHWLPQLVEACRGQDFFKIPATVIAKVPLTLLQLTRLEYTAHTPTTLAIVDHWAYEAFRLDESKDYFVKIGTYSSKFDFRNCRVRSAKEVHELGEYLLYVHFQALQMASPLTMPHPIYGMSTTNEWVVREYIPDKEKNPAIYYGMPLHTEFRVFVDCDTDEVIGIVPYWEPETMKQRFGHEEDANSPHQLHDYVIYKAHEETLMRRYEEHKDEVVERIRAILPALDLMGQWSVDVMLNGSDFWIIDMALAERSYFYDCVPKELRRPSKENWIPELKAPEKGFIHTKIGGK